MRFRLRIGDYIIIISILLFAFGLFLIFAFRTTGAVYAEIYQDDTLVQRIRLVPGGRETIILENNGVSNTIEIDGETARFSQATCPDRVCVNTGTLTRSGETAVCLPSRTVLKLTGEKEEADAVLQ